MDAKNNVFKKIWELEKKIFTQNERSTKKDLKEIFDIREFLEVREEGYVLAGPLEEVEKNEVPDEDNNYGKKNTLYIFSIGVIPTARGKGIGKQLLLDTINNSEKPRISLDTTNSKLKTLCLKLGFKQITNTYFVFVKL